MEYVTRITCDVVVTYFSARDVQICEFEDENHGVSPGMDDSPANSLIPSPMASFFFLPGITDAYAEPTGLATQVYRVLGSLPESKFLLKSELAFGSISWVDAQSVRPLTNDFVFGILESRQHFLDRKSTL